MKRMGSAVEILETIALVQVYVKCRNDLGSVWSKVVQMPHRDEISVYFSQTTEQIICITPFPSRMQEEKPHSIKEQNPAISVTHQHHQSKIGVTHQEGICVRLVLCEVWYYRTLGLQPPGMSPAHWWRAHLHPSLQPCFPFSTTSPASAPKLCARFPVCACGKVNHSCLMGLKGHDPRKIKHTVCTHDLLYFWQEGKTKSFKIQITLHIICHLNHSTVE